MRLLDTLENRELTLQYRLRQFEEPVRDVLKKIGYIKPLSDVDNNALLETAVYTIVVKHPNIKMEELNALMFKFWRRVRWKWDVRLPYYWGAMGIHVLYSQFTTHLKMTFKHPEDQYFVDDVYGY